MKANYFVFIALLFMIFDLCLLHVYSQTDTCNKKLDLDVQLKFDTSSLVCNTAWTAQGFILRYVQVGQSTWSFVLSAPNTNSYVAIAFSPDGNMVGSSAIVGWVGSDGTAALKQYYLRGQSPGQVIPDQGNLNIVGNSSSITTVSSRLYMGFQLNTDKPDTRLLYAVGPTGVFPLATSFRLTEHVNKISTTLNYATGQSDAQKNRPYSTLRKSHGAVNMVGWGILIQIGALVARFGKKWDPLWFYAHISIQSLGFIFGVAGVASGFLLENKSGADVDNHRAFGICILALGCLQVAAFLARPGIDSKYRKYWNWYHYNVGRLLIILAALNIFYGIHLGKAGHTWNIGYGIVVGVLFVLSILLEITFFIRK